jgi:anhydro-N-acetylmuramic acid kinase
MSSETNGTSIRAIGLMSGTSLDGLDIAHCTFTFKDRAVRFTINCAETIEYPLRIRELLLNAIASGAAEFCRIHTEYGKWTGLQCRDFITKHRLNPDLIASHGHTIFHNPAEGFTTQIGSGADIAAVTGITTVCDFRSLDVALGGQGAPLVPAGDQLLFSEYAACVNIGGFSNLSMTNDNHRIAWDICPANYVLNHYASKAGMAFDKDGETARTGKLLPGLFERLQQIEWYKLSPPKSLGREWVESVFFPLIDKENHSIPDLLHTLTVHIASQIANVLPDQSDQNVLFTGGGALNIFLMELIAKQSQCRLIIPDSLLTNYKEALIFALLGSLRILEHTNCLSGVTGARSDSVSGAVYFRR